MLHEPLFRPEALLASMGSRFGNAIYYQPLSIRILVLAAAAAFLCFMAFAAFARIKESQPARGILTPLGGETHVYSNRTGVFMQIHVREGQSVEAGTVLATLHDPRFSSTGEHTGTILMGHLAQQKIQLQEQIRLSKLRSGLEAPHLHTRIDALQRELQLLQEEQVLAARRLELAQEDYTGIKALYDNGLIAAAEHNKHLAALYSLRQNSKASDRQLEQTRQRLQEARQQLKLHPISTRDELLTLQTSLEQLHARDAELATNAEFTLTAPVDGRVSNLLSRPGEIADPKEPVLTLIPENYVLQAELYLPSSALGEIEAGQQLMLSYDAYPYETYGSFAAEVIRISETTIDPREILIPLPLQEPVYLLEAKIPDQTAHGKPLRPGMQFSAEIVTGSQSILGRLLRPLHSLGRRL